MLSPAHAESAAPVAVTELRKTYRSVVAVDGISFALAPGSVTALLGGNGAGKTTTIAMLLGLVAPTSGEVRVFGADMTRERGATIVLASHNMAEVERLADRAIMLEGGRIVADGAPGELIATYGRETLEDVFLDIARGRTAAADGGERSP